MSRFAYKAVDSEGRESFGIVEADTEADALSEIGRRGLFVEDVHPAHAADEWRLTWREQKEQRLAAEKKRQEQARARHPRQRLVVRYADGRTEYGVCFALNPKETSFHLDRVDEKGASTGKTVQVRFADLKAVFQVKSFDGKFDRSEHHTPPLETGDELVVEFRDGEVIRGHTQRNYDPDSPRFFLVPRDHKTNNLSVLVERKAVAHVYTPEEHKLRKDRARAERREHPRGIDLSQEETTGDFYFETRNYDAALEQYEVAIRKYPHVGRLRRKILASQYNIGVQFIKKHEYDTALVFMDKVLEADPGNSHAGKKAHQLRRIIERKKQGQDGES